MLHDRERLKGVTMKACAMILVAMSLSGCGNGPFMAFPGGALDGPEAAFDPSTLPDDPGVIVLETNPVKPYSVKVNAVTVAGQLYIDPAEDRQWYQYLKAEPELRFRFDGKREIYPARAVRETDATVLGNFEQDRIVLRLEPR